MLVSTERVQNWENRLNNVMTPILGGPGRPVSVQGIPQEAALQ